MTWTSTRHPRRSAWWRRWFGAFTASSPSADLVAENVRLRRAVAELSMVNDVAREIAGSFDTEQVVDRVLHRARRAVRAEQAAIVLVAPEKDDPARTLARSITWHQAGSIWHLDQRLLGWMETHRRPLLSNRPRHDAETSFADVPETVRHLLCVPMLVGGELVGVLTAINRRHEDAPDADVADDGFGEDDARLLSIIAGQSAQVVEAARLYERERALVDVEEELRAACRIQRHLLPGAMPAIAGYEVAASLRTAGAVGGDVYDAVAVGDGRWAFVVLDVTGCGVPAALLASSLHASLRAQLAAGHGPAACLQRLDRHLRSVAEHGDFATCFLGILDPASHRLDYSVAGHEPGLLIARDGRSVQRLATGDPLLGVLPDPAFHDQDVDLAPGDTVVLYTDGVTDRFDTTGERFGAARLAAVLQADPARDATDTLAGVVVAVDAHGAGASHPDDEALLLIRRIHPEHEAKT
jgi:serine phosphatase RsbU (regulator of sigma subunit)